MAESHLQKKLRELGLSADGGMTGKKCTFKLFFPRPPHDGIEYKAAKCAEGYNFVGLVLGHGGSTLQKVQKTTGAKIEIHDQTGNLNGSHPDLLDPSVHALIITDSPSKLEKASRMIADTLQPVNGKFQPFIVKSGGAATLTPVRPKSATKKSVPVIGDAPKPSQQSMSKSESGSSESGPLSVTAEEPTNVWNSGQHHPFLSRSQDLDNVEQESSNDVGEVWGSVSGIREEEQKLQQQQQLLNQIQQQQNNFNTNDYGNGVRQQQDLSAADSGLGQIPSVEMTNLENGRDPNLTAEQLGLELMQESSSSQQFNDSSSNEDQGWSSWKDNQHQFFAVLQDTLKDTIDNVTQNAALDGDKRLDGLPNGGPFPQYTGKNKALHIRASSVGSISLSSSSTSSNRLFFPLHSATFPQASYSGVSAFQTDQPQFQRLFIQQSNRHPNGNYSSPLINGSRSASATVMAEFDKARSSQQQQILMESQQAVKMGGAATSMSGSLLSSKLSSSNSNITSNNNSVNNGNGSGGVVLQSTSGQLQQNPLQLPQINVSPQLQQQQQQAQSPQQQQLQQSPLQSIHHHPQAVTPEHFAFQH
eukprot:TRINITY_DN2883_c0_g1_i5.p1 TRINITY_DN2883_c0_g1~~TRINITY_DN2883_c0_g1_i5.p1  ORF type:complete len:587 (-),score=59.55 TRINITY_DN2883_c0_g1_i5:2118-3878(-)